MCSYFTLLLGVLLFISSGLWYISIPILEIVSPGFLSTGSAQELFKIPSFWGLLLLITILAITRDFVWRFYRRQFRPYSYHIVQELKFKKSSTTKSTHEEHNLVFEGENRKSSKSRGFSFSQTFGQGRVLKAYSQSYNRKSKIYSSDLDSRAPSKSENE